MRAASTGSLRAPVPRRTGGATPATASSERARRRAALRARCRTRTASSTAACDGVDQFVRGEDRRSSSGGTILCACATTYGAACAGKSLAMIACALGDAPLRRASRNAVRALDARRRRATSSTMPSSSARSAEMDEPLSMNSSAARAPISRGRRCVPPAPGKSPRLDLRQAEFRAGRRNAIIAREREFETAAEAVAVDRRNVHLRSRRRPR